MANTYKNAAVVLTSTGATDLYTCPSGRTAIVQSVNVANVDSSNRDVTVTLYDSSAATSYTVIYNATIPVSVSMNALSTPLVLEPGDIVRVQASAANTLHATASVMEQDATSIHVDGSITTSKIADDAVTVDKLASSLSATTICTSSTRPASPVEGQTIYETDTKKVYVYDGSAWKQIATEGAPIPGSVVQMAFGSTSTQVQNLTATRIATGLQATITPKFASSQIVIQASQQIRTPTNLDEGVGFDIRRNGTVVFNDAANYRAYGSGADYSAYTVPLFHVDSPASTSALTYSVYFASYASRVAEAQDDNSYASTMLLFEVAA